MKRIQSLCRRIALYFTMLSRLRAIERRCDDWLQIQHAQGCAEDFGDCPLAWDGTFGRYRSAVKAAAQLLRPVRIVPLP